MLIVFLFSQTASGTGLAFIIFTEAINQFPGAQFWAVLFFLMLFTLGIDSQFGTLEGVVTSIVDMKLFPNLRKEILTGTRDTMTAELRILFYKLGFVFQVFYVLFVVLFRCASLTELGIMFSLYSTISAVTFHCSL